MTPAKRARLESFRAIEAGWDSYDGKPIDPACIDATIAFLERIGDDLSFPFRIYPTPEGGVQCEADEDGEPQGYLEFCFHPGGAVSGLFMAATFGNDEADDIEVDDVRAALDHVWDHVGGGR